MTEAIEEATAELRRLTPGWSDELLVDYFGRLSARGRTVWSTENGRPRAQAELLVCIEEAEPWTDDVRLVVCRGMLSGWKQLMYSDHSVFFAPDSAGCVTTESASEGASRLSLIEACERALRRYEERKQLKGGDANALSGPIPGSEVARGGTVHPEAASTKCSDCGAMLRGDQIFYHGPPSLCRYCTLRLGSPIDQGASQRQPSESPRAAWDWDPADTEYEL